MDLKLRPIGVLCLSFAALAFVACGASEDGEAAASAQQEALTQLEAARDALNEKRSEFANVAEMLSAPAEEEAEGEESETAVDELNTKLAQLQSEIDSGTTDLGQSIIDFINADPPLVGEPMNETQLAAIRMKSDEDILVAAEFIDKGGDYRRALQIYKDALMVDPDNPRLKEMLETAETLRFMDEERFGQVKKGMTEDEVRGLLGRPVHQNVRRYDDRGVVAWFFPKGEDRSAAAVWFRAKNKDSENVVYKVDFDAVKAGDEDGAG